jgi:hypothetical protein
MPFQFGKPEPFSLQHNFLCPAAIASRSARRSRKLPGSTSIFCSSPYLIIRRRVARLTPSSFAEAVIPRSKEPDVSVVFFLIIAGSRMTPIAPICSGETANNRFDLSSVFIGELEACGQIVSVYFAPNTENTNQPKGNIE